MNILKEKKNLILGILLDLFICIVAFIIFFFYLGNNTVQVSSSTNSLDLNNSTNAVTQNILIAELDDKDKDVAQIVTDEKASDKELKEEKVNKKEEQKSTSPYFIKVNYKANVVTIYTKDKDGKYTVPYKAMVCSVGTYTPKSGIYKTSSKYRWGKLIHDVYGQYATRIVGSILFHSVPYSSNNAGALLYEEYDKLGTKASEGCVRLTVKDSKWIYDNCPSGTMVEFYKSSDPGPLGKPTAQKISSVEECRNWDPTDPASNNPWHTYKTEEEKLSTDISNTITNNVTNSISNNIMNENNTNSVISNDTANNSIIDNSTITDTNSIANNTITDTNTVVNNSISNNITNNNSGLNNNINNNAITNTVTVNNTITENTTISNNVGNTNNNVTSNNNTVPSTNNVIVNNMV